MSKILVIGCGNVGSVGLHKMAQMPQTFSEIHIACRTLSKGQKVVESIKNKTRLNLSTKSDAQKILFYEFCTYLETGSY